MKYIYFLVICIIMFNGCKDGETVKKGNILILKVDYQTFKFEGGAEQNVTGNMASRDSIPLKIDYKSPGDFGEIALYYKPSNQLIFKGSIIWMGNGQISHPATFVPAERYSASANAAPFPGNDRFQSITVNQTKIQNDLRPVWKAVQKLSIVSAYQKSGKLIGIMLYTPAVGIGDPTKWKWLIIMEK